MAKKNDRNRGNDNDFDSSEDIAFSNSPYQGMPETHLQSSALLDETRVALAEIDAAEQRLADGSYGTCTTCGREIAAERLDALPAAPTCVNCAR